MSDSKRRRVAGIVGMLALAIGFGTVIGVGPATASTAGGQVRTVPVVSSPPTVGHGGVVRANDWWW